MSRDLEAIFRHPFATQCASCDCEQLFVGCKRKLKGQGKRCMIHMGTRNKCDFLGLALLVKMRKSMLKALWSLPSNSLLTRSREPANRWPKWVSYAGQRADGLGCNYFPSPYCTGQISVNWSRPAIVHLQHCGRWCIAYDFRQTSILMVWMCAHVMPVNNHKCCWCCIMRK